MIDFEKNAKLICFIVTPFIVCYAISYLIGAFVAYSWSPADWTESLRIFMAIVGNVYGYGMYIRMEWDKR